MELGPSLKASVTPPTTLSYADRARKAQNIRSPIANMVHAVSVSMSTSASSGTSCNTSNAGSINGSSAVPSSSSTDFDAADMTAPTTSNSSVILETDVEFLATSDAVSRQKEGTPEDKGKDGLGTKSAPTAVPNVWQVRKEQMAMLKAKRAKEEELGKGVEAQATEKGKSSVPPKLTSLTPPASALSSTNSPSVVAARMPTMTNGLSSAPTTSSSCSSVLVPTATPSTFHHREAQESGTRNKLEAEKHEEDEDDDPFVVKYPLTNRRASAWKPIPPPVSAPLHSSSVALTGAIPVPLKTSPGQSVPDLGDVESWPEVGVGVTSPLKEQDYSAKGKGKLNEEDELSGEQKGENPIQNTPKSGKTKSKSKWVPIPAEELQAAADAATASVRRQARSQSNTTTGRPTSSSQASSQSQSQSHSRSRTHSRNASQSHVQVPNGFANGGGSGATLPTRSGGQKPGSSSVAQSLTQSRVHSRAGSTQGSPRFSREVRLPPDVEEKTVAELDSRALSQSGSRGASGSGMPAVPAEATSAPLPPVLPVQIQNQQYPPYTTPPSYFPNGQYSPHPNLHSGSHPTSPPPPAPNMSFTIPHPNNNQGPPPPSPQLNMVMGPSLSSLPYQSPYSVYSPSMYNYPPHPGMSPLQSNQMYWPGMGHSPGGSGHQTPLYGGLQGPPGGGGPFVMPPMADYGSYAPLHQVYGHPPQSYVENYAQQVQEYPPMVSGPEETVKPMMENTGDWEGQTRPVVFGNFHEDESEMKKDLPSVPPFSIGLGPGGAGPSRLASTQKDRVGSSGKRRFSKRKSSAVLTLNDRAEVVDLTDSLSSMEGKDAEEEEVVVDGKGKGKMKWEFGRFAEGREGQEEEERIQDGNQNRNDDVQQPYGGMHPHLPHPTPPHPTLSPAYVPGVHVPIPVPAPVPPIPMSSLTSLPPIHTSYPHPIPPHPGLSHLGHFSAGSVTSPTSLGPNGTSSAGERDETTERGRPNMGEDQGDDHMRTQIPPSSAEGSEWEVRDFGYGFGRDGKNGKPKDAENVQRDDTPPSPSRISPNTTGVRPRRGLYSYNTYSGFGDRGERSDRGYASGYGRRGRGMGRGARGFRGGFRGGYGYGYERDRDFDASARGGPPRGGRNGVRDTHPHQQQPSFALTPPPQFQPLPMPGAPHAQENGLHTYIPLPTGFEGQFGYGNPPQTQSPVLSRHPGPAPVPVPVTHIPFPLDPTAYYLLGQLEYYLSPQNMAQDLFLRKKMDSRGWVSISLIASFKRVRQLTMDEEFVRDVLNLSKVVEVRGDSVRMMGWEQFVLPDAEVSCVDFGSEPLSAVSLAAPMMQGEELRNSVQGRALNGHIERHNVVEEAIMKHKPTEGRVDDETEGEEVDEDEEEEEEEVVFVMGGESGLWSPEQNS